MAAPSQALTFIGSGTSADLGRVGQIPPWLRDEYSEPVVDETLPGHPAGYVTSPDDGLVDAVNTALILNKPLLLTGNPGTGKSELAQRIAWEFGLSPLLRFDAQSLSESTDLFYRFDLVRHVAASHLARPAPDGSAHLADPLDFISFGPLGKAILRANPATQEHANFWPRAFPKISPPRQGMRSVVLIDEIDKASRDFPNDLLNAIERLEAPIREVPGRRLAAGHDTTTRPIIVITCNLERELPDPFLRRCIYFHIPDPSEDTLRNIVRARVFPETLNHGDSSGTAPRQPLPQLFEQLLSFFLDQRDQRKGSLAYASGPAELIDWSRAVRSQLGQAPVADVTGNVAQHRAVVIRTLGAMAKHRDDRNTLLKALQTQFRLPA